jgi:hypothetical protein
MSCAMSSLWPGPRTHRDLHEFGDLDELDRLAGYVHRFPPADVGVKRAAEVVLINLAFTQRPAMVLILAQVKPWLSALAWHRPALLESWVDVDMQPVVREPAGLRGSRTPV